MNGVAKSLIYHDSFIFFLTGKARKHSKSELASIRFVKSLTHKIGF